MNNKIGLLIAILAVILAIIIINVTYNRRNSKTITKQGYFSPILETNKPAARKIAQKPLVFSKANNIIANVNNTKHIAKALFSIQAASFTDQVKAQSLIDTMKAKGISAYIITKNLAKKGVWYRVCVGNFVTREEAKKVLANIVKIYPQSFIIIHKTAVSSDSITNK